MTDLDQGGFGFQRVRTYLGPSLGWVDELVQPSVHIKTGGTYTIQPGESLLLVEVAAAVTILLPDVVKWIQQTAYQPATGFDKSITVKDIGGNAANFNIVITPFGQQSVDNIQQSTIISTARSAVRFVPLLDMTGWLIDTAIGAGGGGGGGGGGDVFKAGNNTYTGVNTFNNTITVPSLPADNDSGNAASTNFVKIQGFITGVSLAPYALIASPVFTGDPQAPTAGLGDNDNTIATTGFVQAALAAFSGGAPIGAEYVTSSANATLTNERVLTNTASITWDFTTPGQAKASTAAGGGNVSSSGTPVNGQFARWVTATAIEGIDLSTLYAPIASPLFTGDPRAPTPATADNDTSIATTAYVKTNLANFQPLDADLTSLSGLGGTNTIYYRSAPDIWSPVTFSGLSFSGGVLTVTAGGGNVSNSGAPTVNQFATWTDATHIQGITPAAALTAIGAQPLDADLTSLAAAAATNAIYYRSAADTWGPVTISTGLNFAGGTLTAAGGTTIADTPPGSPANGSLWWESDTGILWMSYNDGNTVQWVAVTGGTSPGLIPQITVLTSGSGTFTTPAGCRVLEVRMVGAGGGGAAGNSGGAGGNGGNTTFSTANAGGGAGGLSGSGGGGGSATGGTVNLGGGGGGATAAASATPIVNAGPSGAGGNSPFGGGAPGTYNSSGSNGAANTGGGGSGGTATNTAGNVFQGGGGGSGGYVELYISSPAPTYSYSVGVGGTFGPGVSGGFGGGSGAAGIIIIKAYV